ncbi:capsular polysaccharide biosynthesis protein [Poseidonocella sedimentorum]|uniref:Capsular polysaccharide export protein n=1 Tax=Poseidonocella sedimentorum TaxID=871652 RepID=A0A1I6CUA5_9RHOB|nr:capsular polysaccharide biosynthesis protein [Poseidonocella sedimentorum]SFQ96756.1 capsular polysaccharide export protein [Poseidonocella sedimentorum]
MRAGAGTAACARPLHVFNGGILTSRRIRRILALAGHPPRLGLPGPGDLVGVWGQSPTARRGVWVARRRGAGLMRIEDAFLRSVHPGRTGAPPLGLLLDLTGVHFDARHPSDLEALLASHPLDDPALLARAEEGIARLREGGLSKYSAHDPGAALPTPGYVLIVDQVAGDAALRASGAGEETFREMLRAARARHPGTRIVIKSHPETARGLRPGHLGAVTGPDITQITAPVPPWPLLENARAVYTVSSQLGFEAILAGQRPEVFGAPFYAGWGLSEDRAPLPRRGRALSPVQLFAAAMLLYPTWYDPCRDRLCAFEDALDAFEAETRAWREDRHGWVAGNMRLWKRPAIARFFGAERFVKYRADPAAASTTAQALGAGAMVWGAAPAPRGATRVEDGFLRSRGLGAALVPPLSLVTDDLGLYYDPSRHSRLEALIAARATLRPGQRRRIEALIATLRSARLSKYNLKGTARALPAAPDGARRILVVGQVGDDASIRLGCGDIAENRALLAATRAANPDAWILYKPHPDVEAGLRPGAIESDDLADLTARHADPIPLLDHLDEVWTMTSLLGFEALLRGLPVTTLGAPFYAGWGLTTDLGETPERRRARPDLAGLAHAALIDYPRYRDPVSGRPCSAEVIAERLSSGAGLRASAPNRALAKLQGVLVRQSWLWR